MWRLTEVSRLRTPSRYVREDITVQLVILDSAQTLAQRAADEIEALLKDKPAAVLGTATGSSPLPLYDELATRCAAGRISFAEVTGFMLDEYVGLPAGHPRGPDALSEDLEAACRDYEAQMAAAGYCDLQILGIGSDGHIGFNEPGGDLDSRTHVGELHEQTRRDNARFFDGDVDAVPTQCITQGLATIMEARKLVLIATGEGKAEAIAQLVEGEVSPEWPATVMQRHDDALVLVDPAAASRLASRP